MDLVVNKFPRASYEILETFETGIVLQGWEVKSLRAHHGNLKSSWIKTTGNEMHLIGCGIPAYDFAMGDQIKERPRKLLIHKRELERIEQKAKEKGYTLLPLKIYTKGSLIKCEIALVRGRKKYEKRQVLKERSQEREVRKQFAKNL